MRTCSYLFLMPILSQEGNGDVTNLAVRDEAETKPGSALRGIALEPCRFRCILLSRLRVGLRCSVAVFAPIPDCIMRRIAFLRRGFRLGYLAFERKSVACVF